MPWISAYAAAETMLSRGCCALVNCSKYRKLYLLKIRWKNSDNSLNYKQEMHPFVVSQVIGVLTAGQLLRR